MTHALHLTQLCCVCAHFFHRSMLSSQPALDCCLPQSPCAPASSHSTSLYTWSGHASSPSPSIKFYAILRSSILLLNPLPRGHTLHLPAAAESVAAVIGGGAMHSWKIQSDGDALISGTYSACQPAVTASVDVPCSALDAVAVLPLPVGSGRAAPIALSVSVAIDYAYAAGLADFGIADDDDDEVESDAKRNTAPVSAVGSGFHFDRVGNGPASALQVCCMLIFQV
jgi:hypothetical protein